VVAGAPALSPGGLPLGHDFIDLVVDQADRALFDEAHSLDPGPGLESFVGDDVYNTPGLVRGRVPNRHRIHRERARNPEAKVIRCQRFPG
jgi:hypothetical protein